MLPTNKLKNFVSKYVSKIEDGQKFTTFFINFVQILFLLNRAQLYRNYSNNKISFHNFNWKICKIN